jgi:hypothetical protein
MEFDKHGNQGKKRQQTKKRRENGDDIDGTLDDLF